MKGGVSSYGIQGKRRWRGLAIGVFGLVILSMLVPLVFLRGLHNGFHSAAYIAEQQNSASNRLRAFATNTPNESEEDQSSHVNDPVRQQTPTNPMDDLRKFVGESKTETIGRDSAHNGQPKQGFPVPSPVEVQSLPNTNNTRLGNTKGVDDESGKSCELTFGSYCLWREEHKEEMKDSMVKKLKDRLFVARAYYPSIAKLPAQETLSRELKQNIQELERVLSESSTDADLPPLIEVKLQKMEVAIAKTKSLPVDCNNVDKKLRQIFDMTEDEANFHMKQSAFLYQLAVQTMPKSLHCLSMRLTVEYFTSPLQDMDLLMADKFSDPTLYHYAIFSKNVLASSVVINSTVMNAKESRNQVFHVLTDGENYFTMKLWFSRNTYGEAAVQVLNIENLNLDSHDKTIPLHLSLPVEFRVSFRTVDNPSTMHIRTEYISIFSHSQFLIPEIFQSLKKVVVLGDDVVVQRDLSALWSINMEGKVNAAMRFCSVRLGQLKSYLGESSFNANSCTWMSGLNVIDLVRWRELDLTKTYRLLVQKQLSMKGGLIEAAALRASLLSFQDNIYALDGNWALSGLGHDYRVDIQAVKDAAVLHYNGNMKPWLELGIPKYKAYWKKFLNIEDQFLSQCNVNP